MGELNVESNNKILPDLIKNEVEQYNNYKETLDFGNIRVHGNFENSNIGVVVINKEMD